MKQLPGNRLLQQMSSLQLDPDGATELGSGHFGMYVSLHKEDRAHSMRVRARLHQMPRMEIAICHRWLLDLKHVQLHGAPVSCARALLKDCDVLSEDRSKLVIQSTDTGPVSWLAVPY